MLVFKAELMYVSKPVGGAGGGGVCTMRTMSFPKKNSLCALRAHNVRTYTLTLAFSGSPQEGDKISIGYITPAFSGARSGWKCYITPAFSGVPNKGDKVKAQQSKK